MTSFDEWINTLNATTVHRMFQLSKLILLSRFHLFSLNILLSVFKDRSRITFFNAM